METPFVRRVEKAKAIPGSEFCYMGRVAGPLLVIILQCFAVSCFAADEQIRQIQGELRKRHLFYGNVDGECSPALTAAISHYQRKKGFPVTGTLDPETRASLGFKEIVPQLAATPFVVLKLDDVRGGNGELLPSSTALFASLSNQPAWPFAEDAVTPSPAAPPEQKIQSPAEGRTKRVGPRNGRQRVRPTTNPFVMAYQSVDRAVRQAFGDKQPRKKRDPKKRG